MSSVENFGYAVEVGSLLANKYHCYNNNMLIKICY
jgi:hypothetical protein